MTIEQIKAAVEACPTRTDISVEAMHGLYEKHLAYCQSSGATPMTPEKFVFDEIEQDWLDREMEAGMAKKGIDPSHPDE